MVDAKKQEIRRELSMIKGLLKNYGIATEGTEISENIFGFNGEAVRRFKKLTVLYQ